MRYSYKSNGIVSRSIRDYRDNIISDFSNFRIWEGDKEFTEGQEPTITIAETSVASNNYGSVGDYGPYSIISRTKGSGVGSDIQVTTAGCILTNGGKNPRFSGSAVTYAIRQPITNIVCSGGVCIYSYEAGNVAETVGQYGPSVINAGVGARRIDSFQFVFDTWQSISRFTGAAECRSYIYEPGTFELEGYNELDYGLVTANHGTANNYGNITDVGSEALINHGFILDRYQFRYGFKKVIGEAQARATNAWTGSGRIISWGRQSSPAIYGYIADGKVRSFQFLGTGGESIPRFYSSEGGSLRITNEPVAVGQTIHTFGDGNFSHFGGAAESSTWNPEEKQMLFSFTGGATDIQHSQTFVGSGRLRNLGTRKAESTIFQYYGSGGLQLKPRKEVTLYQLKDLANYTLEIDTILAPYWQNPGDNTYSWNGTTKLGAALLKDLYETDHEKHTEVYTQDSYREYNELDYGNLVNQGNLNCVAASGTISTNTTATSGCIKVAPGTTLAIAPSNTYTVPTIQTTPSTLEDYGLVSTATPASRDYGWILDSSDLRTPYGLFRISSETDVIPNATFNFVSDGTPPIFRIVGKTALPLDVSEEGTGTLFATGGAAETSTNAVYGQGLWKFSGDSILARARDFIGSGSLKKFNGLAESLTFNPEEKQMLFSILGSGTEKHTEVYIGSGNLFTFSGASESITNVQVGGGLWRFNGDSHDTRSRVYLGSGSLKKFSGLAESITWNPEEKQMLFSILGSGTESHTEVFVGFGNLFTFSGASESTTYVPTLQGLFRLSSFTHASNTDVHVGSGSLKKFSGAAESATWNPEEQQMLFDIRGVAHASNTDCHSGSGYFSHFSSGTESILWAAQHAQGLFRVDGDSHDTRSRVHVGSGSLKKFNGLAESLTFNPEEKQMLFSFLGGITSEKHTEAYVGSGRIRNFATLEAEKGTFDYVGSGTFKLNPRKPDFFELSQLGQFTLDFYSLKNAYINLGNLDFYSQYTNLGHAQLKWLSLEESHEKQTRLYDNGVCFDAINVDYGELVNQANLVCVNASGVITTNTTSSTGCIKVQPGQTLTLNNGVTYTVPTITTTPTAFEDYGLVSDPNAPQQRDYGHILDTLSKVCPFGLGRITGVAKTHFVENIISTGYSVSGKAGVTLFGEANTFWTPPYIADGLFDISGQLHESFTPATEIGSGNIRKLSGAAECIANVEKADGLFRISGDGYCLFSLLHPASGLIKVTGEGEEPRARVYIGSGSLKKFSGAAESATWNPEEKQMLFSFTGEHEVRFTANPPEEGTEIRLSGTTHPELLTFAEQPFGRIPISGEGATPRTRPFIGSGSLKKFSGAAESITFNPEEKQMLFSFAGSGTERVTLNPPEEGAEIRLRGKVYTTATISQESTLQIRVFGDGLSRTTKPFVGSGSLKKFSGAAESITFNPEEKQLLFSFTGAGTENTVAVPPEGDGRLFSVSGATVTSAVSDDIAAGLFRIDGASTSKKTRFHVGSGSLKKFSGAAESITWNPDEKQMLFNFVGERIAESKSITETGSGRISIYPEAGDYRFLPNWNGSGTIRIEIEATYRFAPVWIGSGTLKKFSGAAESITFNPEEKQLLFSFVGERIAEKRTSREVSKGGTIRLDGTPRVRWVPNNIGSGTIKLSGDAKTHYVPHVIGSGGLWSWAGAAESLSVSPAGLFTFLRIQGDSPTSRSVVYTGSGSLKKFQGAAESITWNPDEKQMLFSFLGEGTSTRARSESGQGRIKISGDAGVRFTTAIIGSGTTRLSGEATVTRARDFVGFGSLRKLSGAAESITWNPEEKQMLFSFLGTGAESRTSKLLSQSGVLTVRGTSGDPLLTFAEQPRVEIDITGDSYDLRAYGYAGSGRITNVNNVDESFTRDTYDGSGRIGPLRGIAFVQVIVWQPPSTQVWII